jgi:hypothetical protein
MKKEKRVIRKLELSRETLQRLSEADLEVIAGGKLVRTRNTCPEVCKVAAYTGEDATG